MFRVEALTEEHGVQLHREALKEDERKLTFCVHGRQRVETHVGRIMIDRLVTALATRLDDPTVDLRKTKPW